MRVSKKGGDSGLGPYALSSFTKVQRQHQRKSFTQGRQRASSVLRLSDKKGKKAYEGPQGGILEKYEKYSDLYRFDVIKTIEEGINQMNDEYKIEKLKEHNLNEQRRHDHELNEWKKKISRALQEYFNYKRELVLMKHIEEREKDAKKNKKKAKDDKKGDEKAKTEKKPEAKAATMMAPEDLKSKFKVPDPAN